MKERKRLILRSANEEDCRFLYELRNEEEVRKNSFRMESISYEDHEEWFQTKRTSADTQIFILEIDGVRAGQARIDISGDKAEISYALCREVRGNGYSKWMLAELEQRVRDNFWAYRLVAEVKQDNRASQRIFRFLGYQEQKRDFGYHYEKKLPAFTITMCTYHSAETLEKAVASVQQQSFLQWELLILDNGSADETVDMLREYEKRDDRIHCTFRKDNVGWCKGISLLLERARGTYTMFLGADDYLPDENIFKAVEEEVKKHQPDAVFTANQFVILENGSYQIRAVTKTEHKVYHEEDKLTQFFELMSATYYNSVMHYVKVRFLKEHGIDFFEPFYRDCEGMTEVIARAEKIAVMDKCGYALTCNTSQTAENVIYDSSMSRQWESIKAVLPKLKVCDREKLAYIAGRVLTNLMMMSEELTAGVPCRDRYMNGVEIRLSQRFLQAESWVSSDAIGEMLYYGGKRDDFGERFVGSAGILYHICTGYEVLVKEIKQKSAWLAEFAEGAMERKDDGEISWKNVITKMEGERLLQALESNENPHRIGAEILLRPGILYEDEKQKVRVTEILQDYLRQAEGQGE